jgi:beta-glucosidase
MLHRIELLYTGVRFLRSDFLCFSALNNDLFAAKEGNLYALTCKAPREQLSQGKGIGMLTDKHFFQKSLGNHRTGLFASTVLPLMVMLMIVQSVLPAYAATTRTALLSATLSSGCISPSDCVSKMTLPEKEGQMTQVEKNAFTMAGNSITDITTYFIGSVLSGGGGGPNGAGGTATQWADMVDNFQSYALQTRLGIPLIYGADAVHGHNNVYGATLFPHNIGLGAMHDPALITQIEQVTRDEVLGTGVRWTFAPCVCTPQDIRWGRTYEGYSEVPSDNATDGAAAIVGFQGLNGTLGPTNILATAKHFIGDGHTAWGTGSPYLNEGDAQISEQQLDTIDLPPYQSAVSNKVGSVMISYSSWNGLKDHANQYLITTKLKGTGTDSYGTPNLGFQGFVVSDWQAINQISTDYNYDVRTAINAGIDMVMVPDAYKTFISTVAKKYV